MAEAKQDVVRVVVLKGRTVTHGDAAEQGKPAKPIKTHGENAELSLPTEQALELIEAGFVREIGSDDEVQKPAIPKTRDDTK